MARTKQRTVESHVLLPSPSMRTRPASTLVARDTVPRASFVGERGGELLVIETPGYADPPGRLVRRDRSTFATVATLPGVNSPAVLSPDGRTLLAAGPLVDGEPLCAVVIDLDRWAITRTLPVGPPFAWLDDARFVAQTPPWTMRLVDGIFRRTTRHTDVAAAAAWPALLTADHALVVVTLATATARPLLAGLDLDLERAIALSPTRDVVYTATGYSRISAVRLADGALLWQRPPVRLATQGTTYTLAFDAVRGRVLAMGLGDHDLLALDPSTGRELARDDLGARIAQAGLPRPSCLACVAVRADGLLAIGTDKGVLVELWPDGRWEAHKVAGRAIRSLAFLGDGSTLLVGGAEPSLRVVAYPA